MRPVHLKTARHARFFSMPAGTETCLRRLGTSPPVPLTRNRGASTFLQKCTRLTFSEKPGRGHSSNGLSEFPKVIRTTLSSQSSHLCVLFDPSCDEVDSRARHHYRKIKKLLRNFLLPPSARGGHAGTFPANGGGSARYRAPSNDGQNHDLILYFRRRDLGIHKSTNSCHGIAAGVPSAGSGRSATTAFRGDNS
jgi:hypothetical protein